MSPLLLSSAEKILNLRITNLSTKAMMPSKKKKMKMKRLPKNPLTIKNSKRFLIKILMRVKDLSKPTMM